jgi:hypothetical protein
MDACLKKEQIGTLFVRVGAPEGGLGGGGRGVQPKNHTCLSKIFFSAASWALSWEIYHAYGHVQCAWTIFGQPSVYLGLAGTHVPFFAERILECVVSYTCCKIRVCAALDSDDTVVQLCSPVYWWYCDSKFEHQGCARSCVWGGTPEGTPQLRSPSSRQLWTPPLPSFASTGGCRQSNTHTPYSCEDQQGAGFATAIIGYSYKGCRQVIHIIHTQVIHITHTQVIQITHTQVIQITHRSYTLNTHRSYTLHTLIGHTHCTHIAIYITHTHTGHTH